jgi:hypothetical protein
MSGGGRLPLFCVYFLLEAPSLGMDFAVDFSRSFSHANRSEIQIVTSPGIYADRIAGGDRDHRSLGGTLVAGRAAGARGGPSVAVQE